MPSLLDIRRRIRTVKNMQQITKAMKMVSAAKLRRAQEQAIAARPYADQLSSLLSRVAANVDLAALETAASDAGPSMALLARRPEKKILLIVISSDKGLAGAFNANVVKSGVAFFQEHSGASVELIVVGRRVRDQFRKRQTKIVAERVGLFGRSVSHDAARELAADAMRRYASGEVDAVYTLGNEFKSVLQQRIVLRRILPLDVAAAVGEGEQSSGDYIFEQPPEQLLTALLPRYVEMQVYRSLLESFASEHAARMNAMDTATNNAADMIGYLTLTMNRARQAAITKEIIEIVSGAAALEG